MFPPIVVDLGMSPSNAPVQWVLEACSAASSAGPCEIATEDPDEPPRAVAIVRAGEAGLSVRIEVGVQRTSTGALWLNRELRFAPGDPLRERWRSVGLAVATLAGEVERQVIEETETADGQALDSSAGAQLEAGDSPPAPALAPENNETVASSEQPERDAGASSWSWPSFPSLPAPLPTFFVGVGAVVGQPLLGTAPRWGVAGSLRSSLGSGWQWSIAADYATQSADSGSLDASWLSVMPGFGHRFELGSRLSIHAEANVGARRLRYEGQAEGIRDEQSRWNVQLGASAGLWWRATSSLGIWATGTYSSSLAESRALDARDAGTLALIPSAGISAAFGLGWSQ